MLSSQSKLELPKTEPSVALILFENNKTKTLEYVTQHEIKNGLIQAGRFVPPKAVAELLLEDKVGHTLTYRPNHIVAEDTLFLVWYRPSEYRPMWFRFGTRSHSLMVRWPTLLFVANKHEMSLKVFALGSSQYPQHDATVYKAPLMNIDSNGAVCQGTAKLPKTIDSRSIDDIEATIYDSNFTHINHANTLSRRIGNNISTNGNFQFWKARHKINRPIHRSNLVSHTTLDKLLRSLSDA